MSSRPHPWLLHEARHEALHEAKDADGNKGEKDDGFLLDPSADSAMTTLREGENQVNPVSIGAVHLPVRGMELTSLVRWPIGVLYAAACLLLASWSVGARADGGSEAMAICMSYAEESLALFRLPAVTLAQKCDCVRKSYPGGLPGTDLAWQAGGPGGAPVQLVDCASREIVDFYSRAVLATARSRMQQQGRTEHEIRQFGACVAEGAHAQVRRVAATSGERRAGLDAGEFRRMYELCERTSNRGSQRGYQ